MLTSTPTDVGGVTVRLSSMIQLPRPLKVRLGGQSPLSGISHAFNLLQSSSLTFDVRCLVCSNTGYSCWFLLGEGMSLGWLKHTTVTPLTQVRFPGAARDFLPGVNFQCRLSIGVRTPPCAIACINICAHDKDSVVHFRVRWIMATQTYPARTISDKYTMSML